jgi:hypothetical protein
MAHWWKGDDIIWDRCSSCGEDEVDGGICRYCGAEQTIPPRDVIEPYPGFFEETDSSSGSRHT